MVVVVAGGVNGSEASVVVVTSSCLEPIGKGMMGGGGGEHLLHTAALCEDKYGKVCVNILRSLYPTHSKSVPLMVSLLTQNPKTKQFIKLIPFLCIVCAKKMP